MSGKVKTWIVLTVIIFLIVLMALTLGGRERITFVENVIGTIVSVFQKIAYNISEFFRNIFSPITNFFTIKEENESLKKENEKLNKLLVENMLKLEDLKELRDLKEELKYIENRNKNNYITTNVIAKDPGNWYNVFKIDAGSKDGVTKNSALINESGLVGIVYEVGYNFSKCVTIIDNKSSVSFEVLENNKSYDGILHGSLKEDIWGNLFDPKAKVSKGSIVVTSGQGIYPRGIEIGTIKEVIYDENSFLTKITISPSVDFRDINKVIVILKENEDE